MRKQRQKLSQREKRRLRQERLVSFSFFSPSLIGILVFFVVPFFVVIYYAFVNNPVQHEFVGFDNFKNLFENYSFRLAAKNTAIFSLISVPSAVVFSLILACMLNQKIPLRSHLRTFMLTPLMVPVASVVLIWQVVFSNNGALNEFLSLFGAEKIDWMKSEYNRYVVILLYLWKNLGYNMILFLAALVNVNAGGCQRTQNLFQHQAPVYFPHHRICDHPVPDQFHEDIPGGLSPYRQVSLRWTVFIAAFYEQYL